MLEGLVPEETEGQILGPVSLNDRGGALTEDFPVCQDAVPPGNHVLHLLHCPLVAEGELHQLLSVADVLAVEVVELVSELQFLVCKAQLFKRSLKPLFFSKNGDLRSSRTDPGCHCEAPGDLGTGRTEQFGGSPRCGGRIENRPIRKPGNKTGNFRQELGGGITGLVSESSTKIQGICGSFEGQDHSVKVANRALTVLHLCQLINVSLDHALEHFGRASEAGGGIQILTREVRKGQPGLLRVLQGALQLSGLRPRTETAAPPDIVVLHEARGLDRDSLGLGHHLDRFEAGHDVVDPVAGERIVFQGAGNRDLKRLTRINEIVGPVHNKPLKQIRADVALSVYFTRSDCPGIRAAENVDQLVDIGPLLLRDDAGVVVDLILLVAQGARHRGSLGEGPVRIVEGLKGPTVNLLEVRLAGQHLAGRDIKGDRPGAQAKRIEVCVGIVDGGLEGRRGRRKGREGRYGGAVNLLNAGVVGVLFGYQRVAHGPVVVGALGAAAHPLVQSPIAGLVAEMFPALRGIVVVTLAMHQPYDLLCGAC